MPKTRRMRNPVALSVVELRTLIDALDDYYQAAIALASWGAPRYSEVAPRTRPDIDFNAGTVRIHSAVRRAPGGKLVLGPPKSEAGYRIPETLLQEIERENDEIVETDDPIHGLLVRTVTRVRSLDQTPQ